MLGWLFGRGGEPPQGRASRDEDDRIVAFADALGRGAHVTFHLSLEDPLLAPFNDRIAPLMAKLGAAPDAPIDSPLVTRAIENAQRKNAGR